MCFRNCERPNHILPLVCPSCFCCQYYKNIKHTRQPKYYGNSERSNRHSISRTSLKVLPMLQEPTRRAKHYGNCKNTHGEQSIMGTARTHTESKALWGLQEHTRRAKHFGNCKNTHGEQNKKSYPTSSTSFMLFLLPIVSFHTIQSCCLMCLDGFNIICDPGPLP